MKIKILNRYDQSVIFETDAENIGAAVKAAIVAKADLRSADLRSADLRSANLSSANLSSADLRSADLSSANLSSANLRSANLRSANLSSANLSSANLSSADLSSANLSSADLSSAHLSSAHLSEIKIPQKELAAILSTRTILPSGDLIGWKKLADGIICKLKIPAKAERVGGLIGRKCRASFVMVLEGAGVSTHDGQTKYAVGKKVVPHKFDPNPLVECSSGIHFYITREEAEAHT